MVRANSVSAFALYRYFLLPLLTGVSPHCQVRTVEECQAHTDFVPGYSLAGEGFDITTLEKKEAMVLDLSLWQEADGTCTLCQNPFLEDKPLQRLPLAATDWAAKVMCQKKVHTSLQSSGLSVVEAAASDVKNDWKMGLNVKISPGIHSQVALAGSYSKTADFSVDKSNQDSYNFATHEVSCSYYSFRVHQHILTTHFKRALKMLPARYQPNSRLEYRQLIETYGTHFIKQLRLGGRVKDVTAVRVCETVLDGVTADEVKDCLSLEASASIGGGKVSSDMAYGKCKELKKKKNFKGGFHQTYKERHTEVLGGDKHTDLLFSGEENPEAYKEWLEGLKSMPALLSYSLEPIHTLAPKGTSKRGGLQKAVSEYIEERALWRNCTQPCPHGTKRSIRDPCSCVCHSDSATNAMCCSRERGLSKMTVTIQCAHNLWGDDLSKTDAFVKVFFQDMRRQTEVVWNDDNPVWNTHLDLGQIRGLRDTSKLRIQVWDKDNGYDDDLLGSCERSPQSGRPHTEVCYFDHGRLDFQYHLECGHFLGGPYCLDYVPQQPHPKGALLVRRNKAELVR